MKWDPEKFIFEDYIQLLMVYSYLGIIIGIGAILERVSQKLVMVGCILMATIETILVITSDFSPLLIYLFVEVAIYIFIMGWAQKTLPSFNLLIAFLLLIIFLLF